VLRAGSNARAEYYSLPRCAMHCRYFNSFRPSSRARHTPPTRSGSVNARTDPVIYCYWSYRNEP